MSVLYTVMPPEVIFAPGPGEEKRFRVASQGNRQVLVRREADGSEVIERVLSTDPAQFLDAWFQPGAVWPPGK